MEEGDGKHHIISEFEKEAEEEPSLSQISIATTSYTHTNSSRYTDSSSPNPLAMGQETAGESQLPRHTESALSRDTFPGMRVDEHHTNYILMYDMLTGIRISVSRCQAKAARPLVSEDYTEMLHLAFDSSGNEFTPSSKYDFKFKDYSPWIFRSLREAFKIDAADYLVTTVLFNPSVRCP